jgi:hypothetical protein
MAYDYPLQEVVAFCRERTWGEGMECRAVRDAGVTEVERIRLGPDAKRLARHDVYLRSNGTSRMGRMSVRSRGGRRYDGGSFHMPSMRR